MTVSRAAEVDRPAARLGYAGGPTSDPFQVLAAEHAVVRQELDRAVAAAKTGNGGSGASRALDALADSLRLHQRREELILYPLCERLFGGKEGAASVLREDHGSILADLDTLRREGGVRGSLSSVGLERVRDALEDHFGKEERILFPLIAALLSGKESALLARRLRGPSKAQASR